MSSTLSPQSPDSVALQQPVAYAAVMDQLSQTVQQLLLAALASARESARESARQGARQMDGAGAGRSARPMEMPAMPGHTGALAGTAAAVPMPVSGAALPLSSREAEVLRLIAAGDSNKMIARTLDLSPHTVKRHVANILDKLDLRSRGQAAAWWMTRQAQQTSH